MRTITKATIALLALTSFAAPAVADDVVQVTWRKAQFMSFGSGVGGIIIGDPSVIDVTVQPNGQLVVFGKTPGETNMVVTGTDNSILFNAPIVVMPEDNRQVSIINAGAGIISERSWTCLTRCVQVLGTSGTSYASIQPQGGGTVAAAAAGGAAGGTDPAAAAAAHETAQGVGNANAATAKGASSVGQGGMIITP